MDSCRTCLSNEIPLADFNLSLMVTYKMLNPIAGFGNWAGTFGENPSRMSVYGNIKWKKVFFQFEGDSLVVIN